MYVLDNDNTFLIFKGHLAKVCYQNAVTAVRRISESRRVVIAKNKHAAHRIAGASFSHCALNQAGVENPIGIARQGASMTFETAQKTGPLLERCPYQTRSQC